jgi:hypothetical protein
MRQVFIWICAGLTGIVLAEDVKPVAPDANSPRRLTVENINKTTEVLRDPTIAVDNAMKEIVPSVKKAVSDSVADVAAKLPGAPEGVSQAPKHTIKDPTQMTGSFSQALGRVMAKPGGQNGVAAAPILPLITLAAKSINATKKVALINVLGKNHLLHEGGKCSFTDKDVLYEILVNSIEGHQVVLTLLPIGRQIILE